MPSKKVHPKQLDTLGASTQGTTLIYDTTLGQWTTGTVASPDVPHRIINTFTASTKGQTIFTLTENPYDENDVQMSINGQVMTYLSDYTVSGTTVTYLETLFKLRKRDCVQFIYEFLSGSAGSGSSGGAVDFGSDVQAVGTSSFAGTSSLAARVDHVHDSPRFNLNNRHMTASITTMDGDQAVSASVIDPPALNTYVQVFVNSMLPLVGDGVTASVDCYFSGDGGVSARAYGAVQQGDTLHWNGVTAGFQLDSNDIIEFNYITLT